MFLVIFSVLHRVICNFWKDVMIEIFGSRSTLLHQLLQVMHLINGFSNVPNFHWWSPFSPPPPAHQSVAYTRLRVLRSHRRVAITSTPPAFLRFCHRWIWAKPTIPAAKRPLLGSAWTPPAIREGFHSTSFNWTTAVYVIVFVISYLFLRIFGLSPCSSLSIIVFGASKLP